MAIFTLNKSPIYIVKSLCLFAVRLLLFPILQRGSSRYLFLTPSFLAQQLIFDRRDKRFVKLKIRDHIDHSTARQIYELDDYGIGKLKRESDLVDIYKNILADGKSPLIIDCGGNIGLATKYFSENYPKATVLCVEPDAENIKQAHLNNGSLKVHFFQKAIGCEDGAGEMVDPGLGNNAYRIEDSDTGRVEIVSIKTLLQQFPEDRFPPFIVKIDIEGFEAELFAKNTEWVDQFPLLIIELHDWMLPRTANSNNFIKTISQLDRDFVYCGENVFSIRNKII